MAGALKNQTKTLHLKTGGGSQILDLTPQIRSFLQGCGATQGLVTVSVVGSTAGITTMELEPGLVKDIPEMLDRIAPEGRYHHDETWHDGNGHSHLRSSLIGTSQTFPVLVGKAALGTWQQVVLIDFDNRPRDRKVILTFLGS